MNQPITDSNTRAGALPTDIDAERLSSKPKHYTINLDAGSSIIINKPRKSEVPRIIDTISNNECNDKYTTEANNDKNHNNLKKLSFIRDEDDDEEETDVVDQPADNAIVTSNSFETTHNDGITEKNNFSNEIDNSKDNPFRKSSLDKATTNGCSNTSTAKESNSKILLNDRQVSSRLDERINSPNSLSGDDDHFSESLDYDEDSVKGSPQHLNNGHKSPTNTRSISSDGPTKSSQSNSPKNVQSRFSTSDDLRFKLRMKDGSSSLSNHQLRRAFDSSEKPKIRSFMSSSKDHNDNQKETDDVMIIDEVKSSTYKKDYQETLRYFLKDACFFQIKSINHENVQLSKDLGVWATSFQNESRFNAAFRENRNVILIFSVQQSGAFQGFARMISEAKPSSRVVPWVLPERLSNKSLGGLIEIDWLCTNELSFQETSELINSYNDNKPVKIARDGQQLEPRIGKKLCKLFPHDSTDRVLSALETLKRQASERKKTAKRYDNIYPHSDRRDIAYQNHDMGLGQIGINGYHPSLNILSRIGFPNYKDQTHTPYGPIIQHYPHYEPTDLAQSRNFRSNARRRNHDQINFPHNQPSHQTPNFRQMRGFQSDHIYRGPNGYNPRYVIPSINEFNPQASHTQNQMHFPNIVMNQADLVHRHHPYQRYRR